MPVQRGKALDAYPNGERWGKGARDGTSLGSGIPKGATPLGRDFKGGTPLQAGCQGDGFGVPSARDVALATYNRAHYTFSYPHAPKVGFCTVISFVRKSGRERTGMAE